MLTGEARCPTCMSRSKKLEWGCPACVGWACARLVSIWEVQTCSAKFACMHWIVKLNVDVFYIYIYVFRNSHVVSSHVHNMFITCSSHFHRMFITEKGTRNAMSFGNARGKAVLCRRERAWKPQSKLSFCLLSMPSNDTAKSALSTLCRMKTCSA